MARTETRISDLERLNEFAVKLSQGLRGGMVVALSGVLGSGKTTLAQMVAKALGIEETLRSPTFTILKSYVLPRPVRGIKYFYHFDFYRLAAGEVLGAEEYFFDQEAVCFVEWAEKIESRLPMDAVRLNIKIVSGGGRVISGG